VRAPGGVTVSFKGDSLVTASGAAPIGMVQVTVAAYGPLETPGDLTGVNAAGEQVAMESIGSVFVGAADSMGQPLSLRSGVTSDVSLPENVPNVPQCVFDGSCRLAAWQLNPNTGKWMEKPGAGMRVSQSGTTFTMVGSAGLSARAIPVSDGGLGMWNADIEKKTPACTIIELVNVPTECFGASDGVQLDLQLQNAAGTLSPRRNWMSSASPYTVLYNIRPNVVEEVKVTFPADVLSNPRCNGTRLTISSDPAPVPGFPIISPSSGVTRFNSGAAWGGTGFPRDSGGNLIDFMDVALGTHPCHSHVWFQLP
jgi:hypothetical protein